MISEVIRRGTNFMPGFALLGADPYAKAAADLRDMQNAATQADYLAANSDFTGAITSFKNVAANGVAVVGPEIDAAGAVQVTQPYTQHAAATSRDLAALAPISSDQIDVDKARALLNSIIQDYLIAITKGRAAQGVGEKPALSPLGQRAAMSIAILVIGVGGTLLLLRMWPPHPLPAWSRP